MKRLLKKASCAALLLALGAGGCVTPAKYITAITNANDQIKFLYVQGSRQGIIKCIVGQAGALSQCREMAVVLSDE